MACSARLRIFHRLKISRLAREESGATAILVAFATPILLGVVAFAVDVAFWAKSDNDLQGIADAAVVSAISAKKGGATDYDAKIEAVAIAAANGLVNGKDGVVVTVNNPPESGKYIGNTNAFEVIISQPAQVYFGKLLGTAPTLTARAVATREPKGNPACIIALDPIAKGSLGLSGGSTLVEANNCGIAVNSSSLQAATMSGGAAIVTDQTFAVLGDYAVSGSSYMNAKEIKKGVTSTDPYADLEVPSFSGCDYASYSLGGGSASIEPGVYCGSITVSGGGSLTMNPGVYIISGGNFKVSSSSLYADNVSIAMTRDSTGKYGNVQISGGSYLEMTPTQTGPLTGVTLFMDRKAPTGTSNAISGGSNASIMGSLYFPSQILQYTGGSTSGTGCLQVIARVVKFSGGSNFGTDCGSLNIPGLETGSDGRTLVE